MNRGGLQPSPRRCGSSVSKFNSGTEGGWRSERVVVALTRRTHYHSSIWPTFRRSDQWLSIPCNGPSSDIRHRATTGRDGGRGGGRVITGAAPVSPPIVPSCLSSHSPATEGRVVSPTICPSSIRSRNSCTIEQAFWSVANFNSDRILNYVLERSRMK